MFLRTVVCVYEYFSGSSTESTECVMTMLPASFKSPGRPSPSGGTFGRPTSLLTGSNGDRQSRSCVRQGSAFSWKELSSSRKIALVILHHPHITTAAHPLNRHVFPIRGSNRPRVPGASLIPNGHSVSVHIDMQKCRARRRLARNEQ